MSTQTFAQSMEDGNAFQGGGNSQRNIQANLMRSETVVTKQVFFEGNLDVHSDLVGAGGNLDANTHLTVFDGTITGDVTYTLVDPQLTSVLQKRVMVFAGTLDAGAPAGTKIILTATTPRGWTSVDFTQQYGSITLVWIPADNDPSNLAHGWYITGATGGVPVTVNP